jgi:TIR domain-containing protein
MGSAYDVFISYSHDDLTWVSRFAKRLEDEGFKVARDEVILQPGDILLHAVEQAIRDSAHAILVFSPASAASGWVRQEYAALPPFAATRFYVDFRHVSRTEYDKRVAKIAGALRI